MEVKNLSDEKNRVYSINGPVVRMEKTKDFSMQEMVYVGNKRLIGEVINTNEKLTTIQVYEETTGLRPGELVVGTGSPMSVTLGPGILQNIFDGIERPLRDIEEKSGNFIEKGISVDSLSKDRKWAVTMKIKEGDMVEGGQIFAVCPETPLIEHRSMVPPNVGKCKVLSVESDGEYTIDQTLAVIEDRFGEKHSLCLSQVWPIRVPRPVKDRRAIDRPLITGQRIFDTLFPIGKGGTAAVPGGFGAGKTMTQHQLAKWCDADIIVYVGCGERGNEMTQVLDEFGELIDPKTGHKLTDRTVLIANTSNMPVAAREASIYTGITLAEYYRDMGYHVAMMADSTSRWAEALREISGRLEEMPAEEGFPAYLPSRLSQFYERAGYTDTLCGEEGSVTLIGAVSPPGADFSEPVTQNTKRYVRAFWALDKNLAYARHYPAVNWNQSYSEYVEDLSRWYSANVSTEFMAERQELLNILFEETKLDEVVKLVGSDSLPDDQKLTLEAAKMVRVGFLQQNAFHKDDTYVPLEKQFKMMDDILELYTLSQKALTRGVTMEQLNKTGWFEKMLKMKYDVANDNIDLLHEYRREMRQEIEGLSAEKGGRPV